MNGEERIYTRGILLGHSVPRSRRHMNPPTVYIMSNSNVRGDIDDIICVGERHATTSKIIDIYNAT